MKDCKAQLVSLGYEAVQSYLNSGNLLFTSEQDKAGIEQSLHKLFAENYDFPLPFVLLSETEYKAEAEALPDWWQEKSGRRDTVFFGKYYDRAEIENRIAHMPLHEEMVFVGKQALFWVKPNEKEYLKTAYHKLLLKEPFYKICTIRNGNTFDHLLELLS